VGYASIVREREVFLAPLHPRGAAPPVTEIRSTLVSASLQGLRHMGWEERYYKELPREMHDTMRLLTPGVWIPIATGVAHYGACDRMNLSAEEKARIGKHVSMQTQKTFVGTLGGMVGRAGGTPWTLFAQAHRIWARMFVGGDHCVYKVGPKDALVCITGCPLFRFPYFRGALRHYYAALAHLVSHTVHARETTDERAETSLSIRFSWA
jgi:hypothetical protein